MTRDDVAAAVEHLRDSHSIRGRGMPDILKRAMALSTVADWLARMPDVAACDAVAAAGGRCPMPDLSMCIHPSCPVRQSCALHPAAMIDTNGRVAKWFIPSGVGARGCWEYQPAPHIAAAMDTPPAAR